MTEPAGRVTAYEYDKAGNRVKETITIAGTGTASEGTATNAANGTTTTTTKASQTVTTEKTYVYNDQNRLTDIATRVNNVITEKTSYTYDNNGNQLTTMVEIYKDGTAESTVTTVTNTYDKHNQLTKTVTDKGTVVNNTYNAEGYRVGKEVNGVKTNYLYEGDKIILELDEEGSQKARNIYGTNLLLRTADGEEYYYLYNGHADVTALVTEDGTVAATYYYDAFGNILEKTGKVNNSIRYAGYQYDEETGLYYVNARMYDPVTARFLQEDTYTGDPNDPLSLNLYTYCSNNPMKYWDPTGHFNVRSCLRYMGNAALSFGGSFVGETFDHLVYKPLYTGNKLAGKAETAIWGTKHIDSFIEDIKKNNFDVTVNYFHGLGSNKKMHQYGGFGGAIVGESMQTALTWEAGAALGIGSKLSPLGKTAVLGFTSGATTAGLNGYADGGRGVNLANYMVSSGATSAGTGVFVEGVLPKIQGVFQNVKNFLKGTDDTLAKGTGNPERQLLSGSEWNEYFKYGSENVEWVTKNKGMGEAPKTVNPYEILKEKGITTTLDDMDREILDSGNWQLMGKSQNNLKPDPDAYGFSHSTFKRDPVTGKITNYETYEANPLNPSTGVEKVKRYDGIGETHFNKVTKEYVDTPHVHDKNVPGGVRPANPDEIPK